MKQNELPNDQHAERYVLGAILMDTQALNKVLDILHVDHFYNIKHRKTYAAIMDLYIDGSAIDIVTVGNWLTEHGDQDSVSHLHTLIDDLLTSANIRHHANIVIDKAHKREIAQLGQRLTRPEYLEQHDTQTMLDAMQCDLNILDEKIRAMNDITTDTRKEIYHRISTGAQVSTGFQAMDDAFKGFEPHSIWYIAGDPGHLKTTLALEFAKTCATQQKPVCIFSGEADRATIDIKLAIKDCAINLVHGTIPEDRRERFMRSVDKIRNMPITVADHITLSHIITEIKKQRHYLYIVDYLQIVDAGPDLRGEEKFAEISKTLAGLRHEYPVCIIAISSLSRANREEGRRSGLHNLRGSGQLEFDADIALFLWYEWQRVLWNKDKKQELINSGKSRLLEISTQKNRKYDHHPFIELRFNSDTTFAPWETQNDTEDFPF